MNLYLLPIADSDASLSVQSDEFGMPDALLHQLSDIKSPHRRRESLYSKLLLVYALAQIRTQNDAPEVHWVRDSHLRVVADQLREGTLSYPTIEVGPQGKPSLKYQPTVHYNISHCRTVIACGVHHSPIGLDVENPRKVADALIAKVCSPEEQQMIALSSDPQQAFTRLWTRKEAYVKYQGDGIRGFDQLLHVPPMQAPVAIHTIELPLQDAYLSVVVGK